MPYAFVFDMPVKLSLPLMSSIATNRMDAEWKLLDDVVDEIDRILLRMSLIDLQSSDPCRIINSRVLVATNFAILLRRQVQELYVDLYLMPRDL